MKTFDKHEQNPVAVGQLLREIFHDPKLLKKKIGFVEEIKKRAKILTEMIFVGSLDSLARC